MKRIKGLLFILGILLFSQLYQKTVYANDFEVSIEREDGVRMLVKEGKMLYTNLPVEFNIHSVSNNEVCISKDSGETYGDWMSMSKNSFYLTDRNEEDKNYTYCVKFRLVPDGEGDYTDAGEYKVRFDHEIPGCTITAEEGFETFSGEDFKCHIKAADSVSGVRRMIVSAGEEVLLDKTYAEEAVNQVEEEVTLSREAKDLAGELLTVQVYDFAGNARIVEKSYFIDKEAPKATIEGIDSGQISDKDVTLHMKASDNIPDLTAIYYEAKRSVHGKTEQIETIEGSRKATDRQFRRTFSEDGNYQVTFYAIDGSNQASAIAFVEFRIDKETPKIRVYGINQKETVSTDVKLSVEIEEEFYSAMEVSLGIARVFENEVFPVNAGSFSLNQRKSTGSYTFSQEGTYFLVIHAKDAASNYAEYEMQFSIDLSPPRLELLEETDEITSQSPTVAFLVSDENYQGTSVTCKLLKTELGGRRREILLPVLHMKKKQELFEIPIREEGNYELTVTAADVFGHSSVVRKKVILDCSAPQIPYINLYDGQYLQSFALPQDFPGEIQDLTKVKVKPYLNTVNYNYETVLKEGKYHLYVEAVDEAGNETSQSARFIIDRTCPGILVDGAGADGTVKRGEKVELTLAREEDIFEYVNVNGIGQPLSMDCKKVTLMIPEYGKYKVDICAVDPAQNQTVKSIVLNCEMTAKPVLSPQKTETLSKEKKSENSEKNADVAGLVAGGMELILGAFYLARKHNRCFR